MLRAKVIKATGVTTFRANLKENLDSVFENNQTLIVTRPDDENIVVISEKDYNEMQKEINNLTYLLKLKKADEEIVNNEVTSIDLDSF